MSKTPAQEQLEHLQRLRQESAARPTARRTAQPPATPGPARPAAFEIVEAPAAKPAPRRRRKVGLEVGREEWRALLERLKQGRDFRSRKEMADWAVELLLRLPKGSHRISKSSKDELFSRIDEWYRARGWG